MANIDYDRIPESGRQDLLAILYRLAAQGLKDPAFRADCERWKEERRAQLATARKDRTDGNCKSVFE